MPKKELQQLIIRIPTDLHRFLKIRSAKTGQSINEIATEQLLIFKKNCKKELTKSDIMIS